MKESYTQNVNIFNAIGDFNRERIPERVTHAKGAGAHGTFTATANFSHLTEAKFLSGSGKRTPVFVRFSNYKGEKGTPDSLRDPRGMAIKFYTEEGNFDLTGNSIPVFFIRNPEKLPSFAHSQKRNPHTNLFDKNNAWEFYLKNPESLHALFFNYSERGIPASYREMHSYACHAYRFYTKDSSIFIKFHIKTEQGIRNLSSEEAEILAGKEPDFYTKDLHESIQNGAFPRWTIYIQILEEKDIKLFNFDPFDTTKVWSQKLFPLQSLGVLELNRNPDNYFAEVEQAAFSPSNLVNGIGVSPDPLLLARLMAYPDAQRYRLGSNYDQIPINRQRCPMHKSKRDGFMQMDTYGYPENHKVDEFRNIISKDLYDFPKITFPNDDFQQVKAFLSILNKKSLDYLKKELERDIQNLKPDLQEKALKLLESVFLDISSNRLG
jgi:catalase